MQNSTNKQSNMLWKRVLFTSVPLILLFAAFANWVFTDAPKSPLAIIAAALSRDASDVRVTTGEFAAKTLNVIRIAVPTPEAQRIGLADETTTPASSPPSPWSVHGSADENAFKHSALDPNSLNQNTPTPTTSGDNAAEDGE